MSKVKFKVGDERVDADGGTLRLCETATGKQQWRKIGDDGNPIPRGRAAGTPILASATLEDVVAHVAGTSAVEAIRANGGEEALAAMIPVSSRFTEGFKTVKAKAPAKRTSKTKRKGVEVESV